MKKLIAILVVLSHLTACSAFVGSRQRVSVMTSAPRAEIYANGELVGRGTHAEFRAKRNKDVQIMVKAKGYYPGYTSIGSDLSMTGILDIIGTLLFLIPVIGLAFPGAKTLDRQNVAVEMVPVEHDVQGEKIVLVEKKEQESTFQDVNSSVSPEIKAYMSAR